jgi:hypothetical protein
VRLQYTGQVAVTYMDYLDLDTGKSLNVIPGGIYNVALASGRLGDSEAVPSGLIEVEGEALAARGPAQGPNSTTHSASEKATDKPAEKPDDLRRGVAEPDASTPEIKEN